ncbi:major facilitator superfamily domain-containing protein 8, partial [Aphelenchoides avenae]
MPPEEPKHREHDAHPTDVGRQESFPPPDYPPPPPPVDVEEAHDSVTGVQEPKKTTDWMSIYVASFLAVCGAVQTSLYWSSLWPYLQVVDPTATENFFGYVVALHSLGQMIGSPLMGYWSNRSKSISMSLLLGLVLMFVGNGVYLSAQLLPSNRKYMILLSRLIVGIGS